jgi:hypothetical protein
MPFTWVSIFIPFFIFIAPVDAFYIQSGALCSPETRSPLKHRRLFAQSDTFFKDSSENASSYPGGDSLDRFSKDVKEVLYVLRASDEDPAIPGKTEKIVTAFSFSCTLILTLSCAFHSLLPQPKTVFLNHMGQ